MTGSQYIISVHMTGYTQAKDHGEASALANRLESGLLNLVRDQEIPLENIISGSGAEPVKEKKMETQKTTESIDEAVDSLLTELFRPGAVHDPEHLANRLHSAREDIRSARDHSAGVVKEELTRLLDVLDGILGRGLRRQHVGIVPQNHFDQEDVA